MVDELATEIILLEDAFRPGTDNRVKRQDETSMVSRVLDADSAVLAENAEGLGPNLERQHLRHRESGGGVGAVLEG